MAEINTSKEEQNPLSISHPNADSINKKPSKEEDKDTTVRETKRRKNCPKALDTVYELNSQQRPSDSYHSFTFDTNFSGCSSTEVTPKFGSFNFHVAAEPESKSISLHSLVTKHKLQEEEEEDDDQKEVEEEEETKIEINSSSSSSSKGLDLGVEDLESGNQIENSNGKSKFLDVPS